jgi:hypothetical protein
MAAAPRRPLTEGEIGLARSVFGDRIDYAPLRICRGSGRNPGAWLAFRNPRNDAIALIRTIFFRDEAVADFSRQGDADLFLHEMTHVWQYQTLGTVRFFWRYLLELDSCDYRPGALYLYRRGSTAFPDARLEAQAKMVQDYSRAVREGDEIAMAEIGDNLAGSGLFGL